MESKNGVCDGLSFKPPWMTFENVELVGGPHDRKMVVVMVCYGQRPEHLDCQGTNYVLSESKGPRGLTQYRVEVDGEHPSL